MRLSYLEKKRRKPLLRRDRRTFSTKATKILIDYYFAHGTIDIHVPTKKKLLLKDVELLLYKSQLGLETNAFEKKYQ